MNPSDAQGWRDQKHPQCVRRGVRPNARARKELVRRRWESLKRHRQRVVLPPGSTGPREILSCVSCGITPRPQLCSCFCAAQDGVKVAFSKQEGQLASFFRMSLSTKQSVLRIGSDSAIRLLSSQAMSATETFSPEGRKETSSQRLQDLSGTCIYYGVDSRRITRSHLRMFTLHDRTS